MGRFPSGQREQTVNLSSSTSVVRIHLFPPKEGFVSYDKPFCKSYRSINGLYDMADSSTKQIRRNGFLDIIKTIATIFIIFHHFQQAVDVRFSVINFWDGSFYFGRLVELFFVISGFLITPYVSKIEKGLSFRVFFVRRYLRLIPIVLISTVLDFIIVWVSNPNLFANNPLKTLLETVLVALGIHGIINREVTFANNPMWYISVLLWCYIIFYVVFSLLNKLHANKRLFYLLFSFALIIIGSCILLFGFNYPFLNEYVGRSMVAFFSGVILGIVLSNISLSNKLLVPLFTLITVLFFIPILSHLILSYSSLTILYVIMFCYSPIVILSKTDLLIKLCNHSILTLMAKISFHAFCFHSPIKGMLTIVVTALGLKDMVYSHGLLSMVLYLLIVYGFSTITYFLIEKPLSAK